MSVKRGHLFRRLYDGTASVTPVEAVNASGRIDKLLLTGKKRMALGTDFDVQLFTHRRAGLKGMTARASDVNFLIIRMYFLFHCFLLSKVSIKTNQNNKPR